MGIEPTTHYCRIYSRPTPRLVSSRFSIHTIAMFGRQFDLGGRARGLRGRVVAQRDVVDGDGALRAARVRAPRPVLLHHVTWFFHFRCVQGLSGKFEKKLLFFYYFRVTAQCCLCDNYMDSSKSGLFYIA